MSISKHVCIDLSLKWYFVGANQKEKLIENSITHVLAIHDTAEAQYPGVSRTSACTNLFRVA